MEVAVQPLWAAVLALTLLTLTPGVDTFLVIRNTSRGGFRDGVVSSLGICAGLFVHATVSALGISAVLLHSARAFQCLRLAGAAYLVWLGVVSLRYALARRASSAPQGLMAAGGAFRPLRSLREGLLSNVLNPKAVIFYMAFLPQFIHPSRPALPQALLLAACHFAIAMIWQCFLALVVNRARRALARPGIHRLLEGFAGGIILLLGLRLALDR